MSNRNRIIIYILIVVLLGVGYYFANNYTNNIKEETEFVKSQNNLLEIEVAALKEQYLENQMDYDSYQSYLDILPNELDWSNTILLLESIETKYGLDTSKVFEQGTGVIEGSRYTQLSGNIQYHRLTLNVELTNYNLNKLIVELKELNNAVVIDYVSTSAGDGEVDARIDLAFLTYKLPE